MPIPVPPSPMKPCWDFCCELSVIVLLDGCCGAEAPKAPSDEGAVSEAD